MPFDIGRSGNKRDIVQVDDLTFGQDPALKGVGVVFPPPGGGFRISAGNPNCSLADQVVIGWARNSPTRRVLGTERVSNNEEAELWKRSNAIEYNIEK